MLADSSKPSLYQLLAYRKKCACVLGNVGQYKNIQVPVAALHTISRFHSNSNYYVRSWPLTPNGNIVVRTICNCLPGYEAPEIELYPQSVLTVDVGEDAEFQCRILRGYPTPELTWTR